MDYTNDLELILDNLYNELQKDNITQNIYKVFHDFVDLLDLNKYVNKLDIFSINQNEAGNYDATRKILYINTDYFYTSFNKNEMDKKLFIYSFMVIYLHEFTHVYQEKIIDTEDSKRGELLRLVRHLQINSDFYQKYYKYSPNERDANFTSNLLLILYYLNKKLFNYANISKTGLLVTCIENYKINLNDKIFNEYGYDFDYSKFLINEKLRYGFPITDFFAKISLDNFIKSNNLKVKTMKYLISK